MLVLAIDIGTSSCKIGVFSESGLVASISREYPMLSPVPGYAELDAVDIWNKVKDGIKQVLSECGRGGDVRAVSFSSMGEAFVPVRLDRSIVGPSPLAYDIRGGQYVADMIRDFDPAALFAANPNIIGPNYSMPKIMWLRDNCPENYAATDKLLLWGDFLAFMLGADPFATLSLANRTLLLDVKAGCWSRQLLDWAGIAEEKLAKPIMSGEVVGTVAGSIASELGLGKDVLIVAGGHDQCCNALGCGSVKGGDTVVGMGTYETYCPVFPWPEDTEMFRREGMNIEHHVVDGLYVSFLHNHSGLLVNWFRRAFAPHETPPAGKSVFDVLNAEMPDHPTRLLFLPHNEPPYWPKYLDKTAGVFVGMKTTTTRGEMFRALLEGITFFYVDVIDALDRTGIKPNGFLASGGGSRSDSWMQMRADILGRPFTRLASAEGSLTGAAMLAALKAGMFDSHAQAIAAYVKTDRTFTPNPARQAIYQERLSLQRRLYPTLQPILAELT